MYLFEYYQIIGILRNYDSNKIQNTYVSVLCSNFGPPKKEKRRKERKKEKSFQPFWKYLVPFKK
jgi:hypothetical protein